jgi:serine/threonine protein kinase
MTLEGQTLGEFEILERLGQGGMGAVYKARQLSLKRLVALKTLQSAVADDEAYIARFQQEAIAAAALNHPNLVQVYSAGESGGLHWFSMEYVEGESARARLRREGRIDPREALTIAICVATALQYGWRKAALIHRDVKPDNIFLSRDGEVKLGDLGLAKSAAESKGLTSTGHSLGTPYYISPEQARDSKAVDFRADIYSLGCTLFHMIAGRPPFDGTSAAAIMLKHLTDPVPSLQVAWPQCPPSLSELVGKMMQKEPDARHQDYETLLNDLRRAWAMPGTNPAPAGLIAPQPNEPGLITPQRGEDRVIPAKRNEPARDRNATYEIDADLDASNAIDSPSLAERESAPTATLDTPPVLDRTAPGATDPPAAPAPSTPAPATNLPRDPDIESPTIPTPSAKSPPQATPPFQPAAHAPSQSTPAGTGELKLVTPFPIEAPTVAGPIFIPPPPPARPSPAPPAAPRSRLPGAIIAALLIIAAVFYFSHHGKKTSADLDNSPDPANPDSVWRDWVLESRRDGYFLYHRELVDHKDEVTFQRRAVANSSDTFRNGKIRVRCAIPPGTSPAQYVQFYVRMTVDARGAVRRYEAYLTRDSVVFALNDSAQGTREITHWPIPPTPDLPIDIILEIEARKNTFTVSLDRRPLGTIQDDTLPGPGTFGVDAPAETRLTTLAFINLDPPPAAATPTANLPTPK